MKHLFIINPIAGGKKNKYYNTKNKIEEFVMTLTDPYEVYVTKGQMDAYQKIIQEDERLNKDAGTTKNELRVYACGGDGTLNECANGAANRPNISVTHYPCGTGNDFLKTFGIENITMFKDLSALSTGKIKKLDLIDCNGRYGINICSAGIDARIGTDVHKYSNIPVIGGATGYVVSLVINVIKGVTQKFRIKINDYEINKKITLACICNGRYYGGGFNPVPDAEPDDGILDCLIVEPVSRFQVAKIVGRYAKGMFREFPEIFTHIQGQCMEIECDREFVVNIDGEAMYTSKVIFKLIPGAVNFVYPEKLLI